FSDVDGCQNLPSRWLGRLCSDTAREVEGSIWADGMSSLEKNSGDARSRRSRPRAGLLSQRRALLYSLAFENIQGVSSGRQGRVAMKIVVIGGTGLIGSKTVAILRQSGHEVVAASPN